MRILVITPKLPYPPSGADEQDRYFGIQQLVELGHQVRIVAKVATHQTRDQVVAMQSALSIAPIRLVPYVHRLRLTRLLNPYYLDGAAFEFTDPKLVNALDGVRSEFDPEAVWVDGSYAWPAAEWSLRNGLKTIVRSVNVESYHILSDEGYSFPNIVRAVAKFAGERRLAQIGVRIAAITPVERDFYERSGAREALVLPLRALPSILARGQHKARREASPLNIFYSGSTYSVAHNLAAATFVIREIVPLLRVALQDKFRLYITGAKLPEPLLSRLPPMVEYVGYVSDYPTFLSRMDIALAPSLGGAGMQQKIFEPLALGIPTVTSARGIAGYPFVNGASVLLATEADEFVSAIATLGDFERRVEIGTAARQISESIFSRRALGDTVTALLS